jgi:hypothetical protein
LRELSLLVALPLKAHRMVHGGTSGQQELFAVGSAAVVFPPSYFLRVGVKAGPIHFNLTLKGGGGLLRREGFVALVREDKGRFVLAVQIAGRLERIGVRDSEANLRNKVSRGGFTGAFLIQCLVAMGVSSLRLEE